MSVKIRYLFQAILVPISLILYYAAPKGYSAMLCNIYLSIFIISSINLLSRNLKGNIIVFEFFFIIAFYFTNYVYPTFYYLIDPYFSLFQLPFNELYITKATALATLGISSFNLGIYQLNYIETDNIDVDNTLKRKQKKRYFMLLFLAILFIVFIYNMRQILSKGVYTTHWGAFNLLVFEILIYLFYFFIFLEFNRNGERSLFSIIFNSNKIVITIIFATTVILLYIGSRTIPMRIILITLCLYTYFNKPMKIKYFVPIFIIGFLLMFIIGEIRSSSDKTVSIANKITSVQNIFEIGNELTINNRSLYVLMEHADKDGYSYGSNFLMNILSVVPFLQSFVLNNFDIKPSDISSAIFVTDQVYSKNDPDRIGLGTNLIGDIYLAFGSIGVMILMFILGYTIKFIHLKALKKDPIYILIYALIFMDAVYYTRSSYLTPLRNIAWVLAIYKIDNLKFKSIKSPNP